MPALAERRASLTSPWVCCRSSRRGSGWGHWTPTDTSACSERHPVDTTRSSISHKEMGNMLQWLWMAIRGRTVSCLRLVYWFRTGYMFLLLSCRFLHLKCRSFLFSTFQINNGLNSIQTISECGPVTTAFILRSLHRAEWQFSFFIWMILSQIKLVFLACYDSTKCSCLCYASQSLQLY